jgi:hypothetical protein
LKTQQTSYRTLVISKIFTLAITILFYEDQQIHWLEWLKTKDEDSDFKDVYNHIRCAPMLCYLADSLNFITYPVVNEIRAMKGVNNKMHLKRLVRLEKK